MSLNFNYSIFCFVYSLMKVALKCTLNAYRRTVPHAWQEDPPEDIYDTSKYVSVQTTYIYILYT